MTTSAEPMEPLMTAEEVGEVLRCSARMVKRYARIEGLPKVTIGRRFLFHRDKLDRWIAARESTCAAVAPPNDCTSTQPKARGPRHPAESAGRRKFGRDGRKVGECSAVC